MSGAPPRTEPFRAFAVTVSNLHHFGALLQATPKLIEQLSEEAPDAAELTHLASHAYLAWPIVANDWREYGRLRDETVLCRVVDAFQLYLTDVIRLALRAEPRLLKSGATMKVEEVLEFHSIDEVVEHLVARKVEELAYRGFAAIAEYIQTRMGVRLSFDDHALQTAMEAIALRNIIVHNRGLINERFIDQTNRRDAVVGQRHETEITEVFEYLDGLGSVAAAVDEGMAQQFSLSTEPLRWGGDAVDVADA